MENLDKFLVIKKQLRYVETWHAASLPAYAIRVFGYAIRERILDAFTLI